MNTRTKLWFAAGVLALVGALNWYFLTARAAAPSVDVATVESPVVSILHKDGDRREIRAELDKLHTTIEKLQDTVRRIDASAARALSRIEVSEALAQSAHERVTVLEENFPDLSFDTLGGALEIDATGANPPPPEPDGAVDAQEELDPIEKAAASFYAQRVDEGRTNEVISLIEQQMAQGALGNSDLISTECNNSACRAVVQHHSGEDALQFDLDLPLVVGAQFDSFVVRRTDLDDGYYETEIYMGRDAVQ